MISWLAWQLPRSVTTLMPSFRACQSRTGFVEAQVRAVASRLLELSRDAGFGAQHAGARLPDADHVGLGLQRRKPRADVVR